MRKDCAGEAGVCAARRNSGLMVVQAVVVCADGPGRVVPLFMETRFSCSLSVHKVI